jgi:DNA-directed RNA polymerase specialized sigma24 family protein
MQDTNSELRNRSDVHDPTGGKMATIQQNRFSNFAAVVPTVVPATGELGWQSLESHQHRLYSLAFWMTDHELLAAELVGNTFRRAFAECHQPAAEDFDRCLIAELREQVELGELTLECVPCSDTPSVRRNTKRIHLERAVVQLPATERLIFLMHDVEGYGHARIARALAITERQSEYGLHQARLRMRELLSAMA